MGATKVLRRLRSASRAARSLASRASLARCSALRLGVGLGLGLRLGLRGGLLLRVGLGAELVGDAVADDDGLRETGVGDGVVGGGDGRGGEGAHDSGGGEGGDARDVRAAARHTAGRAMLPGGTGERHGAAVSFPSISPTGLADGFGAGRSPTDSSAGGGVRFTPGTEWVPGSPGSRLRGLGDHCPVPRLRRVVTDSGTDARRLIFQSPNRRRFLLRTPHDREATSPTNRTYGQTPGARAPPGSSLSPRPRGSRGPEGASISP